jgi:glycosyltransferase involved in cell wall biosynthesis
MPDPIKVTHVVLSLDCGGLERIVLALVREGQRIGQQVAVLCLERPGELATQVESLGATLHCIHKRPGLQWRTVHRLKNALRELHPDVVHCHQTGALFYAGPAAQCAGVPLVVHTEHGNHFRRSQSSLLAGWRKSWLWWLAARYAAKFFCVTQDIADELAGRHIVPRNKLEVLANGIDVQPFLEANYREEIRRSLAIPADAPVLGTVGRLNEIKCQDLLIRAFARLHAENPKARLLLVGDGPLRGSLEQLAAELRVDNAIHFAGYQLHPERYLHAMDVFALTSRTEGMPLAMLEAWAAGLPVIASAVGGIPALIQHGRNGLLFPRGDEVKLASMLCQLIRDPGQALSLGEAGRREVMTRYNLRCMAHGYEHYYRQLLGRSTPIQRG